MISRKQKRSFKTLFALGLAAGLIAGCAERAAETPIEAPAPKIVLPQDITFSKTNTPVFMPDFSYAGYGFGVEDIPDFKNGRTFKAIDFDITPDDGKDDSKALLSLLKRANKIKGQVIIQLPAGRIEISDIIPITRSNILLRGMGEGSGGTEIHMPRPLSMVENHGKFDEIDLYLTKFNKFQREPKRNIELKFSNYSWTGGFFWIGPEDYRAAAYLEELDKPDTVLSEAIKGERGEQIVEVEKPSGLKLGDDVELVWYSRDGEKGGIIDAIYGPTREKIGSHHWSFPERGLVRQKTEIISIDGKQVTLADPLLHPISSDVPASFVDWAPLRNVGIEDVSFTFPSGVSFGHHLEQGFNAIYFAGAMHGWVRDVTIDNADSGILSSGSANLTIDNLTTTGEREAHYAVHAGNVHNVLISDLSVRNKVRHALTVNTQSTKTVFLRSEVFQQPTLDQHAGCNHQNLFDQTIFHITPKSSGDEIRYPVWNGSGAGYWQPGHGRFNTTYNLELRVKSGGTRDQSFIADGIAEGPDARLIGVWGNRPVEVNYHPKPLTALIGAEPAAKSLYEWQLEQRQK